jgi:transcriptional regulator with XRE-family HTH domain
MTPTRQTINLKAERLNRGLSMIALAKQLGTSRQTIWNAENGKGVGPALSYRIADFYGYRVTDIWPVED